MNEKSVVSVLFYSYIFNKYRKERPLDAIIYHEIISLSINIEA